MNFSQGHSGTEVRSVNRACFPEGKHQNSHKNGRNSYELFVLALSLVWFAGATPDLNGVGGNFPFFPFFVVFLPFFVFLRFSSFFFLLIVLGQEETTATYCNLLEEWPISLRPRLHDPVQNFPTVSNNSTESSSGASAFVELLDFGNDTCVP